MDKTTKLSLLGAALLAGLGVGVLAIDLKDPEACNELQAAALKDKSLVPYVVKLCPDAQLTPDCCKLQSGNLCRYGLEYGPGKGGIDAEGKPLVCSCAKADAYLCEGTDKDEGERVDHLKRTASDEVLLEEVAKKVAASEPKEEPGQPSENPRELEPKGGGR